MIVYCDLDGVLAVIEPDKDFDPLVIGNPTPFVGRIKDHITSGDIVKIFTARANGITPEAKKVIEDWCLKHIGKILNITCIKDKEAEMFYDDRCLQVEKNTGRLIVGSEESKPEKTMNESLYDRADELLL